MPDKTRIDAALAAIKSALNPPVPVAMTPEEFLKYAGEQLSKLANEDGDVAKNRVLSLNAAFAAMKAAGEAKLEKGDVIPFEDPAVQPPAVVAAPPEPTAPPVAPAVPATPEPEPTPDVAKRFCWPQDMADRKALAAALKAAAPDKK